MISDHPTEPNATWGCPRLSELGIEYGDIIDARYGSRVSIRDLDGIARVLRIPGEATTTQSARHGGVDT